jgi:hypothetical protein
MRLGVVASRLAVAALLLSALVPAAAADDDPVAYAQQLASEATGYAGDGAATVTGLLPTCDAAGAQWLAGCTDGNTFVGCGTDALALYRCRLLFQGQGGDVDGSGLAGVAGAAASAAGAVPGRAAATAADLQRVGSGGAILVVSEADSWVTWSGALAFALRDLALATKQGYQDAAVHFAVGVETGSGAFAQQATNDAKAAALAAVNDGAAPDYRFTAAFDSGPVTVSATDKRPADDPCSPGTGLRAFGSDCLGPMFFDADARASLDCNAYTSIALRQPCGGYVSTDWDWTAQGTPVYPRALQAARLSFAPDGHAVVHDAGGVLHCNAPPHENGYWVQSLSVAVSESTFNEAPLGHQDANSVALFGDDAGSCSVQGWGSGYRVTYDVTSNGVPLHVTGTFSPEGTAQPLAGCQASADTRTPESAACNGVIHTGE